MRFENLQDNRRYFYQLDGEGIRYMVVNFLKAISSGKNINNNVPEHISLEISQIMDDFEKRKDVKLL